MLEEIGRQVRRSYRLSRGALCYLAGYDYPGNARELRNVLQVAAFMTAPEPRATIRESHLRQSLRMKQELEGGVARPPAATAEDAEPRSTGQESARAPMSRHAGRPHAPGAAQVQPCHSLKEAEARHIETLLEHYGGHRQKVASALGISERTLYRKLRHYSLKAP